VGHTPAAQPPGGNGGGSGGRTAALPAIAEAAPVRPIDADAFNRFEAAGWEARATSYAFLREITRRVIGTLVAAAEVCPGRQVLDVGCGPGDLACAAAALGADTVGIDVAPSMVRRAALANPSIPFRVGSFEAIPAGTGAFDAVVGNFVLNHVGRPELAMQEARRVLRPGGWLAIAAWDSPRRNRILGLMLDAVAAAGAEAPRGVPAGPVNFRSDEQHRDLFEAAGFVQVGISHIMFEAAVPDADTLWRGILASAVRVPSLVIYQPAEVQAAIRSAFDALCEVHRRPDRTLAVPVSVQVTRGKAP
jgi:ubiquinone/menaquinone biosynthesis C-methylase UbiE